MLRECHDLREGPRLISLGLGLALRRRNPIVAIPGEQRQIVIVDQTRPASFSAPTAARTRTRTFNRRLTRDTGTTRST